MPARITPRLRIRLAECPCCGWFARYPVDHGRGWFVVFCPACGPQLRVGYDKAAVPACYVHLWLPRSPRPWSSAYGRRA
jgi:RNase P subunit RPR2